MNALDSIPAQVKDIRYLKGFYKNLATINSAGRNHFCVMLFIF